MQFCIFCLKIKHLFFDIYWVLGLKPFTSIKNPSAKTNRACLRVLRVDLRVLPYFCVRNCVLRKISSCNSACLHVFSSFSAYAKLRVGAFSSCFQKLAPDLGAENNFKSKSKLA